MTTPRDPLYAGYRYPAGIISYAVWLYFRFPLSLRMVEEMLAARGISVTYETIRQWSVKFGREFANRHRQLGGLRLGGSGIVGYLFWMTTPRDPLYAGYRYPAEIISYAVWLYFRFPLSLRMVEEMLAARGISVTYETIRQWGLKFGREFANRIRRRAPCRGDKWHLDGVSRTQLWKGGVELYGR
jgi:putative transposase